MPKKISPELKAVRDLWTNFYEDYLTDDPKKTLEDWNNLFQLFLTVEQVSRNIPTIRSNQYEK